MNEQGVVELRSSRVSKRKQSYIEIFGVLFFLLPMAILIMYLSWPMFMDSFVSNEQSSNSGGLVRWPVKLLIPVGFALLVLAGVSRLLKCVGYLRGLAPAPLAGAEEIGRASCRERGCQ